MIRAATADAIDGGAGVLKHTYDLSDEVLCKRWLEHPLLPVLLRRGVLLASAGVFDRSPLTRWRNRMGEDRLQALLQESLSVATPTKAIKPSELSRVIVDTTVQPKNVTFPTDAKLLNRKLVRLAQLNGVDLRQSYARVGKYALIQHQRYAHAKQFKRANRALKMLRTYLGRVIRDIGRKIDGNSGLEAASAKLLPLARRVREQQQRQRGPKVYSLHAPGSTASARARPVGLRHQNLRCNHGQPRQGRPVRHPRKGALPGNPYDGHTLATVVPEMEATVPSHASSPTRAIAATTRRPITSSGSSYPARSEE